MAEPTTQSAQLTTTATTEGNATTATPPAWDTETFGLGTSTAAEGEKEDDYDTNKYFKTYDGEWYSRRELEEAIWEKFKDVYNWKHMRGSTANAISNDVLEIINGLYSGDLTIHGGLLYTVKGSENYDKYSSWKSKYEGNKPHHANSKYDSAAKNNAAWVVMNAFRTLTDEDTKKKSLQESASTSSLAALKNNLSENMLLSLGIPDPSDLSNWYDIDALDESTLTRGTARRLEKILGWLDDIGDEYSQKELKKEYGLTDKQISQFKSALIRAYEAIQDGKIDSGDLYALDALRFFGVNLNWGDLLKTDFGSDEWKADQANKRKQEEEERLKAEEEARLKAEEEAYNKFKTSIYQGIDELSPLNAPERGTVTATLIQNYENELSHMTDEQLFKVAMTSYVSNSNNRHGIPPLYAAAMAMRAAASRNLLPKVNNETNTNEYYLPIIYEGGYGIITILLDSNNKFLKWKMKKITEIPALEEYIKKIYETNNGRWDWEKFKTLLSSHYENNT